MPLPGIRRFIQLIGTITQILFYLTIATVAVLTYRRARVTILQPIRTEIFKVQVDLLKKLLHHFVGKGDAELIDEFGLRKTVEGNVMKMAGAFGKVMFDLEPPIPAAWEGPDFPGGVASLAAWHDLFTDQEHPDVSGPREPMEPVVRASLWSGYVHEDLVLADTYCTKVAELRNLLESPLMPNGCARELEAFLQCLQLNVLSIRTTLTAAAAQFPVEYHGAKELEDANFLWISNQCIGNLESLKPKADAVIAIIRNYFAPDKLTSLDWPSEP